MQNYVIWGIVKRPRPKPGDNDGDGSINVTMEVNDCGKSIETLTWTTVSVP